MPPTTRTWITFSLVNADRLFDLAKLFLYVRTPENTNFTSLTSKRVHENQQAPHFNDMPKSQDRVERGEIGFTWNEDTHDQMSFDS